MGVGVDERLAVRFRVRSASVSAQELYQLEQRVGDSPASYSQSLGGVTARSRGRAAVEGEPDVRGAEGAARWRRVGDKARHAYTHVGVEVPACRFGHGLGHLGACWPGLLDDPRIYALRGQDPGAVHH